MHSQDRTRELAADLASTILLQEPISHMEFARNRGIEAATGEWILVVDADECIPAKLADRLREYVARDTEAAGIWIPRMDTASACPSPTPPAFPIISPGASDGAQARTRIGCTVPPASTGGLPFSD